MSTLFLLSGNKEIDALIVRAEEMTFMVNTYSSQINKIAFEIAVMQRQLQTLLEIKKNLKSKYCIVISLAEYAKLKIEIQALMAKLRDLNAHRSQNENARMQLTDNIDLIKKKIAILKTKRGVVLEFKGYG